MNKVRGLIHALGFGAGLFLIVCTIIFLLNKELWFCDLSALCLCLAIGFMFGALDQGVDEPFNWVAENQTPEEDDKITSIDPIPIEDDDAK